MLRHPVRLGRTETIVTPVRMGESLYAARIALDLFISSVLASIIFQNKTTSAKLASKALIPLLLPTPVLN